MNVRHISRCALFAAASLVIFILESYIPPVLPVPGIKPGLANIVTLAAVYILGSRSAFAVLMVRIILSSIFAGQSVSFIYSLCGGLCCYAVTIALKPLFKERTIWFLGVIGAVFHNLGQLAAAFFMLGRASLAYYGLILTAAACITGTFTGFCAQYLVLYYNKIFGRKYQ